MFEWFWDFGVVCLINSCGRTSVCSMEVSLSVVNNCRELEVVVELESGRTLALRLQQAGSSTDLQVVI